VPSIVLLSRRSRLMGAARDWEIPDTEFYLFDSPSEALAKISLGTTAVFVFDARDYPRFRHVVRKFDSMNSGGHDDFMEMVGGFVRCCGTYRSGRLRTRRHSHSKSLRNRRCAGLAAVATCWKRVESTYPYSGFDFDILPRGL